MTKFLTNLSGKLSFVVGTRTLPSTMFSFLSLCPHLMFESIDDQLHNFNEKNFHALEILGDENLRVIQGNVPSIDFENKINHRHMLCDTMYIICIILDFSVRLFCCDFSPERVCDRSRGPLDTIVYSRRSRAFPRLKNSFCSSRARLQL